MTDYLSVTRLASRVCTSGDLHSESNEKPVDPIEGIKVQQRVQKRMETQEPSYSPTGRKLASKRLTSKKKLDLGT